VIRHIESCLPVLRGLVAAGYDGRESLERRIAAMDEWLRRPALLRGDAEAHYADVIEIDLDALDEPLVACPNDPDDVRPLSEVAGRRVDEVFIGSCMTNLGHFRAAGRLLAGAEGPVPARLWIAPPTSLVRDQLRDEGAYAVYGAAGARTETPGCSLCMGNQARVGPGATVVSTSTRNFPNRMGRDAQVFLASAEIAALAAVHHRLPTVDEYRAAVLAPAG
jgi:aconitate hydratase 2/2-methylisocitrate dehydratase